MINVFINVINQEIILIYCCFVGISIICYIVQQHINKKYNIKKYDLKYENKQLKFENTLPVFSKKGVLSDIDTTFTTVGTVMLFFYLKLNELINTFLEGLLIIVCYVLLIMLTVCFPSRIIGRYLYRKFILQ